MARKGAENTKKVAGNAKKAEAANKKKQIQEDLSAAAESEEWSKGAKKGNKKKEDEQFKKDEAARKKSERDALLQAEESALPTKPLKAKQRGADKVANKRTGKIDDFLDFNKDTPELSASGIDSALDALALTSREGGVQSKDIDKHPERRVKAAYAAFEEKRIPELKAENPGLRLQELKNLIHKEFQKAPENPMNQDTNIHYNATREDVEQKKGEVRASRESKYA